MNHVVKRTMQRMRLFLGVNYRRVWTLVKEEQLEIMIISISKDPVSFSVYCNRSKS